MKAVTIKGVSIGTGMPKTVVSLTDVADLDYLVGEPGPREYDWLAVPDCIEWRADYRRDLAPDALAGTCLFLSEEVDRQPLIFTCRTMGQGGLAQLSASAYADVCRTVIETGQLDIVDIELAAGEQAVRELIAVAHAKGVVALVSHHDFSGTPDDEQLERLLLSMASLRADICKLAVMAKDENDCERLMRATRRVHDVLASDNADLPLCTIAMGAAGVRSRLEGERFGSALTFCSKRGRGSAPGQVELAEAFRTLEALHANPWGRA